MKLKFSYWDMSQHESGSQSIHRKIRRAFEMIDTSERTRNSYGQYLLSSLDSDFFENRHRDCDLVLIEISKLENGELNDFVCEFDGFIHYISRDSVTFEHAIFGVCPHWPLWSCPFSHYKIAVQAARDFYAMPASLDTEVIVELPESDMAKVVLFPAIMIEREESIDLKHD